MSLSVGIDEVHLVKNVKLKNVDMINRDFFKACMQRAGIAAGGIFYNVQPGTAAQLKN